MRKSLKLNIFQIRPIGEKSRLLAENILSWNQVRRKKNIFSTSALPLHLSTSYFVMQTILWMLLTWHFWADLHRISSRIFIVVLALEIHIIVLSAAVFQETALVISNETQYSTLGTLLDSQLSWKSGKSQLARWSQEVGTSSAGQTWKTCLAG